MVWTPSQRKYYASEKGRQSRLRYQQSEKCRLSRKAYYKKQKALKLQEKTQVQSEVSTDKIKLDDSK